MTHSPRDREDRVRMAQTFVLVALFVLMVLLTACTSRPATSEVPLSVQIVDRAPMVCAWGVTARGEVVVGATAVWMKPVGTGAVFSIEIPGGAACVPTLRAAGIAVDDTPRTFPIERWGISDEPPRPVSGGRIG